MAMYYFTINLLLYLFLFTILFISSNCKDTCFIVNFDCKGASEIIKKYREYIFKISVFMFILSLIICEITDGFSYFGLVNCLYISLAVIKYISCHNEIKKETLKNKKTDDLKISFFSLGIYDFYFNLFLTLYSFYLIFSFRQNQSFSQLLYVIPLTLFFINILIIFSAFIIKQAPDFNIKEVKNHIVNLLWIISFLISVAFALYESFIIYNSYFLLILSIGILIINVTLAFIYHKYISIINKPYNFKVENEKVTQGKVIEINLTGTKVFINFKNKKSYLLVIGFFIFFISYLLLVYLFII